MKKIIILLAFAIASMAMQAQQIKELKLKLNESGDLYIKATFSNQVWLRYNQSNPGTLANNDPADNTFDIGLRRTRMQLFGQIAPRIFFYTQIGMNNFNYASQNAGNRKFQIFFHDALGEFKVFKNNNHLKLGAGLTIAGGLSRFSQPSVTSIMTMDVPVFAQATVEQTDEFARSLSFYARGQIGRLDYRVVVSDPFLLQTNGSAPVPISDNATFALKGHHMKYQTLLIWNFFDSETHTTPYMTGTYLGTKKVLNLEAGAIIHPKSTWTSDGTDTSYHTMVLWSIAGFLDMPVKDKGAAINAYLGYFNTDYGPGYIRNNGIMNPASGSNGTSFNGGGNAVPMFGTGQVMYAQTGYKFKDNLLGELGTLMPYASATMSLYDRLADPVLVYNVGLNWLINGHTSKITLDYQNRPVFLPTADKPVADGRRSALTLQYQIYF